jgi:hypothetical protein
MWQQSLAEKKGAQPFEALPPDRTLFAGPLFSLSF